MATSITLENVDAGYGSVRVLWLGEGCHLNRDTASTIESADLSDLELERFDGSGQMPYRPHISGFAIR